jgi:hypothetical protein
MTEQDLIPATDEDVLLSLSFALHFDGRRRFPHADEVKARLVAEHLLRHLKRSNFVIMRGPPRKGHSTPT